MQSTFWDKRSKKYDDKIRRHGCHYLRTVNGAKSLLTGSDLVLDFGCASGEMSLDIARHVQRVSGIDVSEEMIELAKRKARDRQVDNAYFDQADAFDQRLESGSFSAVAAFNVLHLLDDIPRTLTRLADLLEPGGLLISETPCLGERSWLVRSLINLAQKAGLAPPIQSLTFTDLESLLSSNGFEIVESRLWDEEDAVQRVVARKPDSGVGLGYVTSRGLDPGHSSPVPTENARVRAEASGAGVGE